MSGLMRSLMRLPRVGDGGGVDAGDDVGAVDDLLLGAEGAVDVGVGPELLDRLHRHLEPVLAVCGDDQRLRAEPEHDPLGLHPGDRDTRPGQERVAVVDRSLVEVHRGGADEARDEHVRRVREQPVGGVDLHQQAPVEHSHTIPHRHRLHLVVGDVDGGDPEPALERGDLRPRLDAELRVEIRERLVEQEDLRPADDRAAHRHTLALAARECLRLAVEVLLEVEHLRRLGDAAPDLGLREVCELQGEPDVVGYRHVRVERVALEHHRHVPRLRRQERDVAVADRDRAGVDPLEPRQHPEARGLATTRRTDEDEELSVLDIEREVVDRRAVGLGVGARCVVVGDGCHSAVLRDQWSSETELSPALDKVLPYAQCSATVRALSHYQANALGVRARDPEIGKEEGRVQ